jgi:hypothetical protein
LALFLDIGRDGLIAYSLMMMVLRLSLKGITIEKTFREGFSGLFGEFSDVGCSNGIFGRIMPKFG